MVLSLIKKYNIMYKILEFGGHRTEAFRGVKIVGMSVCPPDVSLSPYLAKKKRSNGN